MAIDVCSEISSPGVLSPRISFSHDLKGSGDAVPVEEDDRSRHERLDRSLLDSDFDFDFCVGASSFVLELCPADELFSDGKILPGEIRRDRVVTADHHSCRQIPSSHPPPPPPPPFRTPISSAAFTEKKSLKELLSDSFDDSDDYDDDDEEDEKPPPKPFWQFKRSCSLNCDVAKSGGLIRSSLQFLSRSNSTGSAPNPKDKFATKDNQRQNLQKQPSISSRRSSSESYQSSFGMPFSYTWPQSQKPPTKKRHGHGVRVNPVLNFQPHITIGTVSLFGLGSLFCNGKVRKKKK
ncbi:uncharacterized protein LOC115750727 [Rhodamnia argentea]|uniref:Uncharacterized protein LOC115750727 n=1 Tax=Rhodamnia argentea TaxID=178133 RepID=A0A8B8QAF8_9MYRT|nr:uncharacterized protein LOC115750727 [Rhodamnia argentea]